MSTPPQRYSFPIARRVFRFLGRARANWLLRHQNSLNFWLHMLGIPLALAGLLLLPFLDWQYCLELFFLGYLLQWIGHRIEGNDVGEIIPIKKLLGLPYVAIVTKSPTSPTPQA